MAHGKHCIGIWKNSKLGGKPDGRIEIDSHTGNTITGLHFNTNEKINGTCNGTVQNFRRKNDPILGTVNYKMGKITQVGPQDFEIKGKFDSTPTAGEKKSKTRTKVKPLLPDDWEADKST